jgi:DNA-binding HxlR family transcriptional regulator
MKWDALEEEPCSLARTIGVIGDRWSLLILRECFLRTRRFEGFQSALGITRHLLAERLKKLVRQGVLRRIPYQEAPKRHEYILTQKGLDLYPVMMALVHWGDTHMVDDGLLRMRRAAFAQGSPYPSRSGRTPSFGKTSGRTAGQNKEV